MSGFDLVDDESKPERRPNKHMPSPAEWTTKYNPAYAYYASYMRVPLMDVCVWWLRGREGGGCRAAGWGGTQGGSRAHGRLLAQRPARGPSLQRPPRPPHPPPHTHTLLPPCPSPMRACMHAGMPTCLC